MNLQLNHTFVWCRDKGTSAAFLTEIFGLADPVPFGSMLVVQLDNNVSLDFRETDAEILPNHYAFLISEVDFDQVLDRFRSRGLPYWADPEKRRPGEVFRHNGGRGMYFDDPDGHILEVMTRPYALDDTPT